MIIGLDLSQVLSRLPDVVPYFQQQLHTLLDIPLVGDVRGAGLMAAVEMTIGSESEEELLARDFAIDEMVDKHCPYL